MRCARSCLACPCCESTLAVVPSDKEAAQPAASTSYGPASIGQPPYVLECAACHWSSRELGPEWIFEKPTAIGHQVMERERKHPAAAEYEKLQAHFESHVADVASAVAIDRKTGRNRASASGSKSSGAGGKSTTLAPSRHISAASSAALNRASQVYHHAMGRSSRVVSGSATAAAQALATAGLKPKKVRLLPEMPSQDLTAYRTDASPRTAAVVAQDLGERLRGWSGEDSPNGLASLDSVWEEPWLASTAPEQLVPMRTRLRAKLIKRCADCNHTLIRPESKASSTRYKIKVVAADYLPALEVGNRRRLRGIEGTIDRSSQEDMEKSVSRLNTLLSVRDSEERERLDRPLSAGSTVRSRVQSVPTRR